MIIGAPLGNTVKLTLTWSPLKHPTEKACGERARFARRFDWRSGRSVNVFLDHSSSTQLAGTPLLQVYCAAWSRKLSTMLSQEGVV